MALFANGLGTAAGARRDLRGQGRRLRALCLQAGAGGAIGAGLFLLGDLKTFERVVPWLVVLGAMPLLRDRVRQ